MTIVSFQNNKKFSWPENRLYLQQIPKGIAKYHTGFIFVMQQARQN